VRACNVGRASRPSGRGPCELGCSTGNGVWECELSGARDMVQARPSRRPFGRRGTSHADVGMDKPIDKLIMKI
jgi:hypothetical protein